MSHANIWTLDLKIEKFARTPARPRFKAIWEKAEWFSGGCERSLENGSRLLHLTAVLPKRTEDGKQLICDQASVETSWPARRSAFDEGYVADCLD